MTTTTQEIHNKVEEIKKQGNWVESPFRQINWIPSAKILNIIDEELAKYIAETGDIQVSSLFTKIVARLKGAD